MPGELLRISDLSASTPVRIDLPDGPISLSVNDVLQWVAPGAPQHEAMRLLVISRICRLDPFRREVHLVPFKNTKENRIDWALVIDKAGWLRMAEDHLDKFNGHESGIIVCNPDTKEAIDIEGEFVPLGWGVVGGWARVHRKDRKYPTYTRIGKEAVRGGNPQWETNMPFMYRKTALVHSLKESGLCFGLSGLYDKGEIANDFELSSRPIDIGFIDSKTIGRVEEDYRSTPLPNLSPNIAAEIESALEVLEIDDYSRQAMLAKRGVSTVAELTDVQGMDIISKLAAMIDGRDAGKIMLPDKPEVAESPVIGKDEYVDEGGEVRKIEEVAEMIDASDKLGVDGEIRPDEPDFPSTVRPEGGPKKPRSRKTVSQ